MTEARAIQRQLGLREHTVIGGRLVAIDENKNLYEHRPRNGWLLLQPALYRRRKVKRTAA